RRRDAGDDGWLIEVAARLLRRPGAADADRRAGRAGGVDQRLDAVALARVDQRADLRRRIEARADAQRRGGRRRMVEELVGGLPGDEEPLRRDAHLAAVAELR